MLICCQRLCTSIWGVHGGCGASNKVVFCSQDFLSTNNVCDKWLGSLILSLRLQNLYSILSLNSSSRFRRVGTLSVSIPGCVLLLTTFIHSFPMDSGSFSAIILTMVELLISFSRPRLFRSICTLSITFIISSISLESASFHYSIHQLALISILLLKWLPYLFGQVLFSWVRCH